MSWGEEQKKEIETIRERKITVKLSDADCDRLARKCGEHGLTREYEIGLRKEGEVRARKKIARKMKSLGIFSNEFIAELVELDIKTIERIKANDEQRETRAS